MKLIDLNCPSCGANMKANAELKKAICNFCGHEIIIDDEKISIEITNGKQFGYDQEIGRQQARNERYQGYLRHLEFVKMKLAMQYIIDMKSSSFFTGKTGLCMGFLLLLIAILFIVLGQWALSLFFIIGCGVCFYLTIYNAKKIDKMINDLSDNNLTDYMHEIENVMERHDIVTRAEEIARKDYGDI